MKKWLNVTVILIIIIVTATYYTASRVHNDQVTLISAYEQYYSTTEALLDSIFAHNPNLSHTTLFNDTVGSNYLCSKNYLDSIIKAHE